MLLGQRAFQLRAGRCPQRPEGRGWRKGRAAAQPVPGALCAHPERRAPLSARELQRPPQERPRLDVLPSSHIALGARGDKETAHHQCALGPPRRRALRRHHRHCCQHAHGRQRRRCHHRRHGHCHLGRHCHERLRCRRFLLWGRLANRLLDPSAHRLITNGMLLHPRRLTSLPAAAAARAGGLRSPHHPRWLCGRLIGLGLPLRLLGRRFGGGFGGVSVVGGGDGRLCSGLHSLVAEEVVILHPHAAVRLGGGGGGGGGG
eukprot:scaffold24531_cov59-Phaeocystis_antarctica.AAC.4